MKIKIKTILKTKKSLFLSFLFKNYCYIIEKFKKKKSYMYLEELMTIILT